MSDNNDKFYELLNKETRNLSEPEILCLKSIFEEISNTGESLTLDSIYKEDYDEIPVDIVTFLTEDQYLGEQLKNSDGKLSIYDYWQDVLRETFSEDSEYIESIYSGAIGLGKSTIAVIGMAYILYKLLCLKNPAEYYGLQKGSKVALAFFNLSLDQVYGVAWYKLQTLCKKSKWFIAHGKIIGNKYPTYYPGKDIEILCGSKMEHFIGRDIFAAMLDELSFAPGSDITFEKSQILKLYTTIVRRIESRYMKSGKIPGMMFLVSSKNTEFDFLEQYMEKRRGKPSTKIVDEPVWVVKKSVMKYSGVTFNVALGNRYSKPRILGDNENAEEVERNGQRVIQVPIEHKEAFELDINSALADIAGIAISSSSKFFIIDKVIKCYRSYLKNPFTMDLIKLDPDSNDELNNYLIESLLPKMNRNKPHHIHMDLSKNGDTAGMSMTSTVSNKKVKRLVRGIISEVTDVVHKIDFAIGVQAVDGKEIPFFKLRRFVIYLKSIGFNIASVTFDSYQSVDSIQLLKQAGFNSYTLSVDRSMDPYISLKNAVNEGRLIMPEIRYLEDEFANVEQIRLKTHDKIDHTPEGHKDILDTIAANIYKANTTADIEVNQTTADKMILAVNGLNDPFEDSIFDNLDGMILPEGVKVLNNGGIML